ncbi:MAG TPA: PQQ-binding-like beta-propeller repeat protein [Geodermatophilus sp.]|nr:PQQ-binding-like beta-propeller repeat protein [Geodermatophilus sp.]
MRPPLRVWIWTAATVALALVAALLWRGSDAAATDSTTAPPADVPAGTPAGGVSAAWSVEGGPVPRKVVEGGRVVVGSEHGVRAHDPVTGGEAWHYLRANALLCDLTAVDGVVVAVFRTEDRCDEAVALDAATGVRAWTRNVNFRPDMTLQSAPGVALAAAPTGVVTLDPRGNNIRWRYAAPAGCRLDGADVGAAGVAVLQRCGGSPARQLRLLDGQQGSPRWTRDVAVPDVGGVSLGPVDQAVTVVAGDRLEVFAGSDGAPLNALPLPAEDPGAPVLHTTVGSTALVWTRGTVWALDRPTGSLLWQVPARGVPSAPADKTAQPGGTPVVVPEADGLALRDARTGAELGRLAAPDLPSGGLATVLGPVVVYRLPGEVRGYR